MHRGVHKQQKCQKVNFINFYASFVIWLINFPKLNMDVGVNSICYTLFYKNLFT